MFSAFTKDIAVTRNRFQRSTSHSLCSTLRLFLLLQNIIVFRQFHPSIRSTKSILICMI